MLPVGLSPTAQAFLVICAADIFLGYHSEEGWDVLCEMVAEHYGFHPSIDSIHVFVAIFPVTIDCLFKYWLFMSYNQFGVTTWVAFKTMDRH